MVKVIQPDKPKPDEELNLGKILEEKQKESANTVTPPEAVTAQPGPTAEQQPSAPQLADKAEPLPPQAQQSSENQANVPAAPAGPTPTTVSPQQPQMASVQEPTKKKSKKKLIVIGAVVLSVVAVSIVGYIWYSSNQVDNGYIDQNILPNDAPFDNSAIPEPLNP